MLHHTHAHTSRHKHIHVVLLLTILTQYKARLACIIPLRTNTIHKNPFTGFTQHVAFLLA